MNRILFGLGLGLLAALAWPGQVEPVDHTPAAAMARSAQTMDLGNFSVSLAVKDLAASRAFYEVLGFSMRGGDPDQNWIILRNGDAIIGLFQGMFEENIMTFNPGWNRDAENLDTFTDIRELQKRMKAAGLTLTLEADESTSGPASVMLTDPDGNTILIDQHR